VDQEVERLSGEIKELTESENNADDDFFKELEDESEIPTEEQFIDMLVFGLAEGDIMKGKMISSSVTLTEALEWWKMKVEFSRGER